MCRFILPSSNFNVERWKWNDEIKNILVDNGDLWRRKNNEIRKV